MGADKEDFQQVIEDENVLISQIIKMGFWFRSFDEVISTIKSKKKKKQKPQFSIYSQQSAGTKFSHETISDTGSSYRRPNKSQLISSGFLQSGD